MKLGGVDFEVISISVFFKDLDGSTHGKSREEGWEQKTLIC